MAPQAPPRTWTQWLVPNALFLGIAAGFAACCLLGHRVTRHNCFPDFVRFHPMIGPEHLVYPTVRQVRALARERLPADKIAVIVGGSSVLQGACQPPGKVWTRQLQEQLGDRYAVLNLGFRAARPSEFGAVAAEVLARERPRLVLLTDMGAHISVPAHPDGEAFNYFFWDAHARGQLLPDRLRDERLAQLPEELREAARRLPRAPGSPPADPAGRLAEVQAQMALNSRLCFNDLWTTLACTHCCTLWDAQASVLGNFYAPRNGSPDLDQGVPPPQRYVHHNEMNLAILRNVIVHKCVKDAQGKWVEAPTAGVWDAFERNAAAAFPEAVRGRTLFLVMRASPYHLRQLSADEQACYDEMLRIAERKLHKLGFTVRLVGTDYGPEDYGDCFHLAEEGAAKLAATVAPLVREAAERLGYNLEVSQK
jgi:hypothetical protein